MHRRALGRRQGGEAFAQHVAGQAVHAQPFAAFRGDEDRRVPRQPQQSLAGVGGLQQRVTQAGMQVVEDRDARQEGQVAGIEVGQQQADEMLAERVAAGTGHGSRPRGFAAAAQGRQRQLQPQRPAFGQVVQAGRGIGVEALAQALVHQLQGLVELQAQLCRPHHRALPVVDEVVDVDVAVGARSDHRAQVGRQVAQQVGQRLQ